MRVLQAMAGRRHGGAEAFFERLAQALAGAGLEQRLVIRREPDRAARLKAAGLAPVELRFGGLLDVVTPWRLAAEIKAFRPQVTLTWMSRATAALPPRWLAWDRSIRVGRLGGYYDLKYYRRCDHLIANTRDLVAYIRRGGWPESRVHYLPNFADARPQAALDRNSLGVPGNAPLALALGRFHPNKAFDVLIQAMREVQGVYLCLAGEGDLRGSLESAVQRFGLGERIKFLGWRDDVGALMTTCDLVICPSRHEPLGNVVVEAWAHGRPVIATASAGPAELITPEETGLLVPVDDVGALAGAITRLAQDGELRRRLAAAGSAAYQREFTEAAVMRRYLDFFDAVAR